MAILLNMTQESLRRYRRLLATGGTDVADHIARELRERAFRAGWIDYYAIGRGSTVRVRITDTMHISPPETEIKIPE